MWNKQIITGWFYICNGINVNSKHNIFIWLSSYSLIEQICLECFFQLKSNKKNIYANKS